MQKKEFANAVIEVVLGVLIHQRQRWGTLLGHRRGYEGWWKAEIAAALESWCWCYHVGEQQIFGLKPETKLRDFGIEASGQIDIVVAPFAEEKKDFDYTAGPRFWLELKERGTWWGSPAKALGTANNGLRSDLEKCRRIQWSDRDIVAVCHILSNDGAKGAPFQSTYGRIEIDWEAELQKVATEFECSRRGQIVGFPIASASGDDFVRWVRMDFFCWRGVD